METSDWINLIAAILVGGGTLFLGIMAWRTIRQNRSMQQVEKEERLLNEIIQWVTDIIEFALAGSVMDEKQVDLIIKKLPDVSYTYHLHRLENRVRILFSKGSYMKAIASRPIHDSKLQEHINKVLTNLSNHSNALDLASNSNTKENRAAIRNNAGRLHKSAKELMEYTINTHYRL